MTNQEFVNKLLEVRKYSTKYAKGTFGQRATNSLIDQKAKQYPDWYTKSRIVGISQCCLYIKRSTRYERCFYVGCL